MPGQKRKVVAITFLALGAVFALKGAEAFAAAFYGFAILYWLATGWWASRPRKPKPTRPIRQATVEIAAAQGRTDGARGAFGRLDPTWQDWLRREARSNDD